MVLICARVVMQVSFYAETKEAGEQLLGDNALMEESDELSFVSQLCEDIEITSAEEKK
jgi:hypothetical protein